MPSVEPVLASLDAAVEPRVHRFDAGPAFRPRVAVLPSAFNPPTRAHLRLLALANEVDGVSTTAVLLSTNNVDKGVYGASLAERLRMLLAVHEAHPSIGVLASNAARIPDQASALREAFPEAAFDFVVGYDTLIRVFEPRYYDNMARDLAPFFKHHRLITTNRGEASYDEVCKFMETPPVREFASRIVPLELEDEPSRLSSTAARDAAGRGEPPADTPPEVRDYIARHGLYREDAPPLT